MIFKITFLIPFFFSFFILFSVIKFNNREKEIVVGANRTNSYFPILKGKSIAIVANQTSVIFKDRGYTHLLDSLSILASTSGITLKKVFSPEHGFRGNFHASQTVKDTMDINTGISIISLYGSRKKPTVEDLKGIDLVVFDIQDVGVRFYTYIATLHYVMEACAEQNIPLLVLDRPNPNGHYIDGPMLNLKYSSFVGKNPVPLVYGMTIGEYAKMINGEKWLKNGVNCHLTVIPLENYTHQTDYVLKINPSLNLPNSRAINLYPSLGFFEGTSINVGRGTDYPFQRYGSSQFPKNDFSYIPRSNFGSKNPKEKDRLCYGVDLSKVERQYSINLCWLLDAYRKFPNKRLFFQNTFTIHAGDTILASQIKRGWSATEIQKSWKSDLEKFKKIRAKYLIYP